jgi:hypothetical protein
MAATGDLQKELQAMWQKVPNEERDEILTRAQGSFGALLSLEEKQRAASTAKGGRVGQA